MDEDIPNYIFNINPLKKIEESKSEVFSSEEEAEKTNLCFNDSSEEGPKGSERLPYESLSLKQNSDSHPEDENELAKNIFLGIKGKFLLPQKILEKLFYPSKM